MPQLGRITKEAILQTWFVEVGSQVGLGDAICEIETDKATVEYESPIAGILLRRIDSGITVPVGEPIAIIGVPGENVDGLALFEPGAKGDDQPSDEQVIKDLGSPGSTK